METQRIVFLDVAKALAILTVLYIHAGGAWVGHFWITPYYMPFFFVMSGIAFAYKRATVSDAIARAKKTAITYFKYSFFVFFIYIPLGFLQRKTVAFFAKNLIGIFYGRKALFWPLEKTNNVTLMDLGNGPMWFLSCLSVAWIWVAVALAIYKKKSKIWVIMCMIAYFVFTLIFKNCMIMTPWCLDTSFLAALFIIFGIMYQKCVGKRNKRTIDFILLGVMGLGYYYLLKHFDLTFNMGVRYYGNEGMVSFFTVVALVGTILALSICKIFESYFWWLGIVGKKTLPILCFHGVIYQYIDYFFHAMENTLFLRFIKIGVVLVLCIPSWKKKAE